ncbi:LexA family protein [Megasphaera sp.]|uniref:LexA family protein n=1 Tax=Megasphaera sp. TaxID=2023260 RepID=UPI003FF071DF
MNAGNRLKQLREAKGLSQSEVAKIMGVGRTTYLKWENGENQPTRKLDQLSQFFDVSIDYLLGKSDVKKIKSKNPSNKGVRIPVLGRVVAGIPIDAIEEIIDYEEIPKEMAATGDFFALKVKGASMEPRILEGDVVIVRKQEDVESGDIAIVLINGNDATVKRVKKQKDGITLIANNISVYEPHYYSNDEITQLPVRILGKVVELRGKL